MGAFFEYRDVFKKAPLQLALISMKSHWDWFVSNLAAFVVFARPHVPSPPLTSRRVKTLASLGRNKPIHQQVDVLKEATGLPLPFKQENRAALKEMTLVRNLGIHNRWEVDLEYKEKSEFGPAWAVGELRTVTGQELEIWERALIQLIRDTAHPIAFQYDPAPDFLPSSHIRAA